MIVQTVITQPQQPVPPHQPQPLTRGEKIGIAGILLGLTGIGLSLYFGLRKS